jgi:hypothetical protein
MTVKDDLHHLVDELDDDATREALTRLQDLRLPRVLREAPIDDEPETDEERRLVQEARQDLAAGHVLSHAEVRRAAALAAEEAEIDAEYERAYREHPIAEKERKLLDAFSQAGIRSLQRPLG